VRVDCGRVDGLCANCREHSSLPVESIHLHGGANRKARCGNGRAQSMICRAEARICAGCQWMLLSTFPFRAPRRECNGLVAFALRPPASKLPTKVLPHAGRVNLGRRAVIVIRTTASLYFICSPRPPCILHSPLPSSSTLHYPRHAHRNTHYSSSHRPDLLSHSLSFDITLPYTNQIPSLIPTLPLPARLFDDQRVVNQTCSLALFEAHWYVSPNARARMRCHDPFHHATAY